jgi:hypothetical protein
VRPDLVVVPAPGVDDPPSVGGVPLICVSLIGVTAFYGVPRLAPSMSSRPFGWVLGVSIVTRVARLGGRAGAKVEE